MAANADPQITIRASNKSARAFGQAQSDMKKLANGAKAMAASLAAVTAGALLVVKQTTEATRQTIAYSDALGVSVENMSRWEYAAESVGLASDKVGDIMKDAADKIGDAFRNNAGEAKEALESLGLNIEVLAGMTPDQQLLAIADALDEVGTKAEKIQILESIGNDLSLMLPLLDDNAAGLQEMADKSDTLGKTLTAFEADQIKKADTALRDMNATVDALAQTFTTELSPVIVWIAEKFNFMLPAAIARVNEGLDDLGAAAAAMWAMLNPSEVTGSESFGDLLNQYRIDAKKARDEIDQLGRKPLLVGVGGTGGADTAAADARREHRQADLDEHIFYEESKWRATQETESKILEFSMWSASRQTEHVVGEAIARTRGVAHQHRALFELNKIAGTAQAVINMHRGVSESLAAYPMPLAGAMAAMHAAAGLAEIQAIQSASFGGGSAGGGGGGAVATPPSDLANAPITNAPQEPSGPQIIVNLQVDGNVYANDDWRAATVEQLQEAIRNDEV